MTDKSVRQEKIYSEEPGRIYPLEQLAEPQKNAIQPQVFADTNDYRFCFLDYRNHFIRSKKVGLENDNAARDRAKELFKERSSDAIEVWSEDRFICRMSDDGLQCVAGH